MTTGKDLIRRALSARKKINICASRQERSRRETKALALHLFNGNTAYDPESTCSARHPGMNQSRWASARRPSPRWG